MGAATWRGYGLSNLIRLGDEALAARVGGGDREAFAELVRRHQSGVYRVCYRVLGDREDARDAAQEAFIRAYRKMDSFEGRSAFRTWLMRLAVNVSLNDRKRRRESLPLEIIPATDGSAGPQQRLLESEQSELLHRALGELKPEHRAAVVLHDLEGMSWEEAAEVLEVPPATARSWAHRGRGRLKELLT